MDILVRTGNCEVIASGNVIVPNGDYVEFLIRNLRFRLSFQMDPRETHSYVNIRRVPPEGSTEYMELLAFNFDGSIINTVTTPIHVAFLDGRKLSLRMSVSSIRKHQGNSDSGNLMEDKLVFYSWCLDFPENQWSQ